jgi:hypothetical protein
VTGTAAHTLPEPERHVVATAWAFRYRVELDAALRFARLGERLETLAAPEALVSLARRAASDEQRHAALCEELAIAYGQLALPEPPAAVAEVAPPGLPLRQQVLYELAAACCITETESAAVLTMLNAADTEPRVRQVLHDLLRDEVVHSRLGWAYLAREHEAGEVAWLGRHIPFMLAGSISPTLFASGTPAEESPMLQRHGVLPHAHKRATFVRTLEEVVLPGLERFGVPTAPARQWLAQRQTASA